MVGRMSYLGGCYHGGEDDIMLGRMSSWWGGCSSRRAHIMVSRKQRGCLHSKVSLFLLFYSCSSRGISDPIFRIFHLVVFWKPPVWISPGCASLNLLPCVMVRVLMVNLTQSRVPWEERLSEGLPGSDWPVVMFTGDDLDCVN